MKKCCLAFLAVSLQVLIADLAPRARLDRSPLRHAKAEGAPGWRVSEWFGAFNATHSPWLYHRDHGWLLLGPESDSEMLYYRDPVIGWLYTDPNVYPQVFSFERSSWLAYQPNSGNPRRFYDQSPETWLDYETEVETTLGTLNGFELEHAVIPRSGIKRGGPPRDGIPSILDPKFISVEEADVLLEDDDDLLTFTVDGVTRAYPYRILNWHEICNDVIGDTHFAVTYCPLCGTGVIFNRRINGKVRTFGVSGMLFLDNVLMYDHQSESLWSQLLLQSVTGPNFKTQLEWLGGEQVKWKAWKEQYPEGEVLSTDTGADRDYTRNPYAGYFADPTGILYEEEFGEIRDDLPRKEWIYGILIEGQAMAIPRDELPDQTPIDASLAGHAIVILWNAAAGTIAVTDKETGEDVVGSWSFWFAWQAFYRETEVWQP